jgi:membrane-associated protease RseP (regulator of RpoE activity)
MDAWLGRLWYGLAAVTLLPAAWADDATPPPQPAAPPAFSPGDISIGEPIALPFAPAPAQPVPAATPQPAAPLPQPPAAVDRGRAAPSPAGAVPGTGWVGLTVAESNVPGRWRVETVAPDGPAARAGIVAGDELRAVDGVAITSADAVAQALTAIAAGQDVRVAVARGDGVRDPALRAEPRPTAPPRGWQPATTTAAATPTTAAPATPAQPVPPAAPGIAAFATAPAQLLPPPALDPAPLPSAVTVPASRLPVTADKRRMALGVRTVPIDAATQARFRLPAAAGAYVIGVVQDLPAAKAGVPPGSVIVSLGERPVRSPVELTQLVTSGPVDRPVTVEFVLPGGESRRADVVLQALEAPLEEALVGALEPAAVPDLGPGPAAVRAERPTGAGDEALRAEIRRLRARLDRLEQVLGPGRP